MNSPSDLDLASLQEAHAQLSRPSARYLRLVQQVGQRIGLDPARIASGAAIEFKGVTFWLSHHGQLDPDGLMLLIDIGTIGAGFEARTYRSMLEHNAMTPAAVSGYYCVLPGTDSAAYCVRMDITKSSSACDAVLSYIGLLATHMPELSSVIDTAMDLGFQQTVPDRLGGVG